MAAAQPSSDPYGFIMDPTKTPKPGKLSMPNGGSRNARLLIVTAGVIIFAIIAAIAVGALTSGGDQTIKNLTTLAEQQSELIRVADLGVQKAVGTDAQNLAITTKYSIESDQAKTLAYLSGQHHSVSSVQLKLLKNTQTDAQLSSAAQNNQFDETFTQVIGTQLINYQKAVTQTYNGAAGRPNAKKLLTGLYNNINVLATQVKGIQQTDQSQSN